MVAMEGVVSTPPGSLSSPECWWWESALAVPSRAPQGAIKATSPAAKQLDMAVPDPEFCRQWGASAFVMDIEMYTTLNPSSSFVTQPTLQPGCVIRRENWSVLRKEGAVTAAQERQCKQRMNTFAYIGSVRDKPVVRCVYQTDITQNKFLTKGSPTIPLESRRKLISLGRVELCDHRLCPYGRSPWLTQRTIGAGKHRQNVAPKCFCSPRAVASGMGNQP